MTRFDIPYCSVCYDYLTSGLCVLTKCGHVYHRKWSHIAFKNIVELKFECVERADENEDKAIEDVNGVHTENAAENTGNQVSLSQYEATKQELEDLKRRLSKAAADMLELQERCASAEVSHRILRISGDQNKSPRRIGGSRAVRCYTWVVTPRTLDTCLRTTVTNDPLITFPSTTADLVQNENTSIREAVLRMQEDNAALIGENKNLRVIAAAHKTSIAKLNELLAKNKAKLKKLEEVHNYLKADEIGIQAFESCLKTLSSSEKLALLTNRIMELEGINKTLTDMKDVWKKKCDEISGDYLVLEREYKALLMRSSSEHQEPTWDPFSEVESSIASVRALEAEHEYNRRIPRSINVARIGSSRSREVNTGSPQRRVRVEVFESPSERAPTRSGRTRTQKISDYFRGG
ncbi:hypothetical protein BBBOND_0204750 [Babesia bigemina]|uniref:Uncharacterized protein n=1 Tax=Babesia bigemina TaxID=5866 RepID=A0A061D5P3_BABBI|nr:hypothetical protein BBBOND_0204750 [Babesia bigemina]CDR95317.1 hypothetical protein BBBOND_0204750 [Babesia bigemina]|eukprot:XP_012767503.1 hypothetical protein BBBOND_0204750 [Babesia bigemina]